MDSTARTGCIAGIVVLTLTAAVGVVVVIAGSGKPAATGAQAAVGPAAARPVGQGRTPLADRTRKPPPGADESRKEGRPDQPPTPAPEIKKGRDSAPDTVSGEDPNAVEERRPAGLYVNGIHAADMTEARKIQDKFGGPWKGAGTGPPERRITTYQPIKNHSGIRPPNYKGPLPPGTKTTLDILLGWLKDDTDPGIRAIAAANLSYLGYRGDPLNPRIEPALRAALKDESRSVRERASQSLRRLRLDDS